MEIGYLAMGLAGGLLLSACGAREGGEPQAVNGRGANATLQPDMPAESRGYEIDVYPNGRKLPTSREVEVAPPAKGQEGEAAQ